MWEGVLLLRIGKAASHILSSARVQMTFASGCFIATNWKTHWCLDSDLSIEIMWLQCWTCVSVLVETPLTFHWRWFLNTDCTRHDKVWDVILQVTSPLSSPLWAFKDPKRATQSYLTVPSRRQPQHLTLQATNTVYCCSVAQSCPTLCNPVDYRAPGFPVLQCLLELAQIHVHWLAFLISFLCGHITVDGIWCLNSVLFIIVFH